MKTTKEVLRELRALRCPVSLRTFDRLRRKLGLRPLGDVRTCPTRWPADTAETIAIARGMAIGKNLPAADAPIPTMAQLRAIKAAAKRGGAK